MGIHTEAVQKLYVAFFNRPADPAGLAFWEGVVANNNGNTAPISAAFSQSPEYVAAFAGLSNVQVVNTIYENLFGRGAESEGLLFWAQALNEGRMTVGDAVLNISAGALATDLTAFNNKVTAATAFTEAVDTGAEIVAFDGDSANALAKAWLSAVTDDASLTAQLATVDATVASVVAAAAVAADAAADAGQTFTLTAALGETVTGTSGNDTFSGVLEAAGGTDKGTLNIGDVINGGTGTDTLNLTVVDGTLGLPAGVTLNSVEIVNLKNTGALADSGVPVVFTAAGKGTFITDGTNVATAKIDASKFTGVTQIWQESFAAPLVEKLATTQTAGFRKTISDNLGKVEAAATATSASVAFDTATADDNTVNEITLGVEGAKLNTINVAGTIDKASGATAASPDAKLILNADVDAGATEIIVNTAVKTDLTITETGTAKDVVTFDASGSTGGIDVLGFAASFANIETIKLGSGNDTITVDQAGKDTAVDLGAGNDKLTVNFDNTTSTKLVATLGAGNDTVVFGTNSATATVQTDTGLASNLVSITDFTQGADALEVANGITSFATQSVVNGLVDAGKTLFENIQAVAASTETTGTSIAQFVFGGNLYLVHDTAGDNAFSLDDIVVELTGVTTLLTGADVVGIA